MAVASRHGAGDVQSQVPAAAALNTVPPNPGFWLAFREAFTHCSVTSAAEMITAHP